MEALRTCNTCGKEAFTRGDLEGFKKDGGSKYGRANLCKPCVSSDKLESYHANGGKERQRELHYIRTYGLTLDDYNRMLKEQKGKCKICETRYPKGNGILYVDHCHTTDEVRGLLCIKCNSLLGNADDNIWVLAKAIQYLGGIDD